MSKNILRSPKAIGCVLALITLALFWPATRYGFIELDDDTYVSGNPYVQQGFTRQSVAWAMTAIHESYWLPLTWISFITDCAIQGPEPTGYHRTNVLLHAANVFLLFLAGYRLTGQLWGSALLAALFGWHPLRVEAVVWISSRKDVLSTFFGLLAILAYVRYVELGRSGGWWRPLGNYLLVLLALAAGLMAKPMLVTLPFVLLLLDFWPLQRFGWPVQRTLNRDTPSPLPSPPLQAGERIPQECSRIEPLNRPLSCPSGTLSPARSGGEGRGEGARRFMGRVPEGREGGRFAHLLLEKAPLLLLIVAFIFITLSTHGSSGAMHKLDTISWADRLVQIPANYCRYFAKTCWPVNLAVRYPPLHTPFWAGMALAFLVIVWTATCWWWARRWPWALIGWLWFLGTFVPIVGLVPIGTADFADRFTYLPSIGLSLLGAGAVLSVFPGRFGPIRIWVAAIVLAACGLATRHQIRFWADGETLFGRALQVTRNNAAAHNALGRALEKQERWPEAIVEYQESLSIAPGFGQAHANLGNVFGRLRRYDEAATHFQAALQGTAEDAKIHSNYGAILYEAGHQAEGVRHLREAIGLNPRLADAHFNLGHALLETGEQTEALDHFVSAARINPNDDAAQFQAGRLYLAQGRRDRARPCFEAALRRQPGNLEYVQALREATNSQFQK